MDEAPLQRFQIKLVNFLKKLLRMFFKSPKDVHSIFNHAGRVADAGRGYHAAYAGPRPKMSIRIETEQNTAGCILVTASPDENL